MILVWFSLIFCCNFLLIFSVEETNSYSESVDSKQRKQVPATVARSATDGSVIAELMTALEEYLSLLIGLTEKERGLEDLVEFKWKNLEDGRQEPTVASLWFEILSVIHLMAMLTLSEANVLMIPRVYSGSGVRVVSTGFHVLVLF